ncbi:MAG: hypothetical protein L0207_00445 [Chlamydiae bacterium]|nr:hypothetical protein [Chlamydiota bacterium]
MIGSIFNVLNQPDVKEKIKNFVSIPTAVFGLFALSDFLCEDVNKTKTSIFSARISLILSAAVSRPGVWAISKFVGYFFTKEQLERAFGPNTIFEINPRHPRHLFSIIAVILALPILFESCFPKPRKIEVKNGDEPWLTESSLRWIAFFNTITSRPVLHIGNQLFARFSRAK